MTDVKTNVLYFGDNLDILRKHIPHESIDLIYLDPPFNSKRDYNILFKENGGLDSEAQIKAFTDTWHWSTESAQNAYHEVILKGPARVGQLLESLHQAIGGNDVMAYLVMMTIRLIELHRVLKPTGSLFLHCDPTASHYLKIVLDKIFEPKNFRNEILWCYSIGGKSHKTFGRKHDVILWYSKSGKWVFNENASEVRIARKSDSHITFIDKKGRTWQEKTDSKTGRTYRYPLDKVANDYWTDIEQLNREDAERLGYPTQKPEALLARIISAASNPGDIVLDPFCGCGTAVAAAEKLNRKWIGIDITYLAINLMRNRLKDSYGIKPEVIGEPTVLSDAKALAKQDRYQFQYWALDKIGAWTIGERKKGADKGIDGFIRFVADADKNVKRVVVQVKSGHVGVNVIRELKAVTEKEAIGVLLTLEPPTEPMKIEAVEAGHYYSPLYDRKYPRIQIITIEELFQGKTVDMPPITQTSVTFTKAPKVKRNDGAQMVMEVQADYSVDVDTN